MAEPEFVGRLLADLSSAPNLRRNIAQLGSNHVPRPAGLPSLGNVLRRHPSLLDVEMGTGTVSLVVGAVEAEYVARLVAHLHVTHLHGKLCMANRLGAQVRRPEGLSLPLGKLLQRHPSLFDVSQVGSSDAVSLASRAEPPAQPSVPQPARPAPQPAQRTPEAEYVAALVAYLQGKPLDRIILYRDRRLGIPEEGVEDGVVIACRMLIYVPRDAGRNFWLKLEEVIKGQGFKVTTDYGARGSDSHSRP